MTVGTVNKTWLVDLAFTVSTSSTYDPHWTWYGQYCEYM